MPRQIETPERETLSFLCRAWSENKDARFRWAGAHQFSADTGKQVIFISNIRDTSVHPDLEGFNRWRAWRFLTFHESLHLKLSPRKGPKKVLESVSSSDPALLESLYRIFEDIRIESVGLETYVGYIPERDFFTAVNYVQFRRKLEESGCLVNDVLKKAEFDEWWIEFLIRALYFRRTSTPIRSDLSDYMDDVVKRAYLLRGGNEPLALAVEVLEWLNKSFPTRPSSCGQGPTVTSDDPARLIVSSGGLTMGSGTLEQLVEESVKGTEKEDETLHGSEDLSSEFEVLDEQVKRDESAEAADDQTVSELNKDSGGVATAMVPIVSAQQWDDLMEGTSGVVTVLKSNLRRWRVGWKEMLSEEGDDLDAEAPILFRLSDRLDKPKIFLEEKKVGSRGRLLVLVDMSGSIGLAGAREVYLRSGGVIAEALKFIGASFELYAFRTLGRSEPILYLVKSFNEPWGVEQRERLASLESDGGTPLAQALHLVRDRARRFGVRRLAVLTDGQPDNIDLATAEVRNLASDGVKVMFLGIRNARLEHMKAMLDFKDASSRVAYIDELGDLPQAFFRLLQASV